MKLYEIDAQIAALENAAEDELMIDPETGELMTVEQALDQMRMERSEKIENIALWCKNLASDARAIKVEEENLAKRRKAVEAKSERLKAYLINALTREDGTTEKVTTPRVAVSVRKNAPSVIVSNMDDLPDVFKLRKIEVVADKKQIGEVLKHGIDVPGAHLEQGRSAIIK